jgi:hypothetical protein
VRSCGPLSARTFRAGSSNPFVQTSAKIRSKVNAIQPPYAACFEPTNQRHLCRRLQKPTQIRTEDRAVAQSVLCRRLHRIVLRGPHVRSSYTPYSGFCAKSSNSLCVYCKHLHGNLAASRCLVQTTANFPFGADICTDLQLILGVASSASRVRSRPCLLSVRGGRLKHHRADCSLCRHLHKVPDFGSRGVEACMLTCAKLCCG